MPLKTSHTVGILGGGQLARYLVEKGQNLGLTMTVLSEDKNDPAAQVTRHWVKGSPKNRKDIADFLKNISILTFESEFADAALIQELAPKNLQIFPALEHIKIFQDRFSQKTLLENHLIATSPFLKVSNSEELAYCGPFFSYKYVLKKRIGGYDGYGTFIVKNKKDHQSVLKSVTDFSVGFIAEAFIPFDYECAASFFRNENGQWTHTPLVFSKQSQSKCDFVYGPIHHKAFATMKNKIKSLMQKTNYVGTLTFEFFVQKNQLIVNETAPRVHNSAHYSLDALTQDQFTLHLKSVLNWDIGIPIQIRSRRFCMVNLVGQSDMPVVIPKNLSGNLYWYGKTQNRAGRKMGHINYTSQATDAQIILKLAQKERSRFKL
ncbi:MAG: ATP-grasp domain-containing protein [Bdellovibrionaceae bacterium]|nr:ATP-grasp domain-containing protein [Pseudobdellovibrionaceae bacterium]